MTSNTSVTPEPYAVTGEELELRIDAGSPTPDELAAITAVVNGVVAELAEARAASNERPAPSAWSRTQRALRGTHSTGPGHWRSFSG